MDPALSIGAVPAAGSDSVPLLLRAEALVELILALLVYRYLGGGWLLFGVLFLVPDLSMVGYLVDRRVGALVYNLAHTYAAPALLALVGFALELPQFHLLALIWAAHIGFDRTLGYGLKYPIAFGATHLGWKGKREPGAN